MLSACALDQRGGAPPPPALQPSPTSSQGPLLLEQVTWRLRWEIVYHNSGSKSASVRVEMPLPQDRGGWQTVRQLSLQPAPDRQVTDSFGNRLAVYEWSEVPAGASVRAQVETVVERRGAAFCPDASQARSRGGGPSRFLVAEPGILADAPVILQTAAAVVGDEHNPYYRLVRLYDFVRGLDYQLTRPSQDDHESLASRVVQCSDAAGLLVSLSRAAGIPARYVAGVFLRPETPELRIAHAWAEAWIEPFGWLPMDPTMGRFADTRNTRLGRLDPAYVVAWEGRSSQGFVATGAGPGEVRLTLRHHLEAYRAPTDPVLPPPSLQGNRDLSAMLPRGRAMDLLKEGMAQPDPQRRLDLYRQAQRLDPGSLALMRARVTSTPPGEPWARLDQELAARFSSPVVHFGRGLMALEEGRWSEAERQLLVAGTDFAVQHALSDLYLRTCQPTRAARALEAATRQAVTFNLANSAVALMADLGDHAGLARAAEEASQAFPGESDFLLARGQALFRMAQEDRALEVLREYRRARPGEGLADAVLGMLYLEQGQADRAAPLLRQGLKGRLEDPDRDFFSGVLRRLDPSTPPPRTPSPPRRPGPGAVP